MTDRGEVRGDCYVLSLGSYSPLIRGLAERIPVYPIKGYSLTVPIDGANNPLVVLDAPTRSALIPFREPECLSAFGGRLVLASVARHRLAALRARLADPAGVDALGHGRFPFS